MIQSDRLYFMLTKSKTNTYRRKIILTNTMVDSNLRIVIITKLKIQLSEIYPKNNKEKLSKQCNTKMFQNDEARNEYKQQLKDKINTIQNPNDGYRQKWKSLCHSSQRDTKFHMKKHSPT